MCFWWQYCTADTICKRTQTSRDQWNGLVFCSQTVIKDVVEMRSTLTGKIKNKAVGAEDSRRVERKQSDYIHRSHRCTNWTEQLWRTNAVLEACIFSPNLRFTIITAITVFSPSWPIWNAFDISKSPSLLAVTWQTTTNKWALKNWKEENLDDEQNHEERHGWTNNLSF